jgi:hypothetical protein
MGATILIFVISTSFLADRAVYGYVLSRTNMGVLEENWGQRGQNERQHGQRRAFWCRRPMRWEDESCRIDAHCTCLYLRTLGIGEDLSACLFDRYRSVCHYVHESLFSL